jgi:hypothetical protein
MRPSAIGTDMPGCGASGTQSMRETLRISSGAFGCALAPSAESYSYRSASIGLIRDALMAGSSPATRPTNSSSSVDVITANCEICK